VLAIGFGFGVDDGFAACIVHCSFQAGPRCALKYLDSYSSGSVSLLRVAMTRYSSPLSENVQNFSSGGRQGPVVRSQCAGLFVCFPELFRPCLFALVVLLFSAVVCTSQRLVVSMRLASAILVTCTRAFFAVVCLRLVLLF
jgi:hypothetical protein